ncbi:MAG: hypothetical protein JWM11_2409, partial [Planctomycetaceae bacterium]|nr:hypothetical protein [Planctomycetaceae bacterium]
LLGAAILGFFIGLMVALVERAFRRVWLEVGYGGREIRAVTLGAEPVSLGSKAAACTIYVGSAPDIAFRYWVEQGKVICEDMVTRQKREMVVGEKQTVGRAEVCLKSGNTTTKASTTTRRIVTPAPPPPPPSKRAAVQRPIPPLAPEQPAPSPAATETPATETPATETPATGQVPLESTQQTMECSGAAPQTQSESASIPNTTPESSKQPQSPRKIPPPPPPPPRRR